MTTARAWPPHLVGPSWNAFPGNLLPNGKPATFLRGPFVVPWARTGQVPVLRMARRQSGTAVAEARDQAVGSLEPSGDSPSLHPALRTAAFFELPVGPRTLVVTWSTFTVVARHRGRTRSRLRERSVPRRTGR